MTIINRSMYPVQTSMNLIGNMQARFATLQTQLATGQKASNLAELGTDRYFDLSIRARMNRIEGYQNTASMVTMRLGVLDQVVGRLDKVEADARGGMTPSAYGTANINFGAVPAMGRAQLDEVLTLLNTDVDGRYLFAGSEVNQQPVAKLAAVLDGAGGKAGFAEIAGQRLQADQGNGLGRLVAGGTGNTATLSEDGDHVFGFKLSTLTATGSAVTLTSPGTAQPRTLSVAFTGQPLQGETVSIGLTLPDGSSQTLTLKATTSSPPAAGEYAIGADADETAANFRTALDTALRGSARSELAAASNYAAADNFFNGQGQKVMRVGGSDFANATALVEANPTNTVIWYRGSDAADARATVSAKIDDAATVNYGAQANESGTLNLVRSLAVQAIQNFSTADPSAAARFDAVATRNFERLSDTHNSEAGSIEMLAVELGTAQTNVANIGARQKTYGAQLTNMLADIETVSKEDVAMEILALQTRLQASYQATSLIASLSLVNYLR